MIDQNSPLLGIISLKAAVIRISLTYFPPYLRSFPPSFFLLFLLSFPSLPPYLPTFFTFLPSFPPYLISFLSYLLSFTLPLSFLPSLLFLPSLSIFLPSLLPFLPSLSPPSLPTALATLLSLPPCPFFFPPYLLSFPSYLLFLSFPTSFSSLRCNPLLASSTPLAHVLTSSIPCGGGVEVARREGRGAR